MKFKDFLDGDIKNFREMKIGLVDKKQSNSDLVRKVQDNFDFGNELLELIDNLNEELGNTYRGKFKFDYVLQDLKKIDKLKINKNRKEKLKEQLLKSNSELAKKQTEIERKISRSLK